MAAEPHIGCVEVQGLKVFAHHGVAEQEARVGNVFEVDVKVFFDALEAMRTDRIDLTVSYSDIVDIVNLEMSRTSMLVEHAVYRIYENIRKRFPFVTGGRIAVYKPQPPLSAELKKAGFSFSW